MNLNWTALIVACVLGAGLSLATLPAMTGFIPCALFCAIGGLSLPFMRDG